MSNAEMTSNLIYEYGRGGRWPLQTSTMNGGHLA